MRKRLISFFLLLCCATTTQACDVCGCGSSLGFGSMGINAQRNFLSLRGQYAGFHAFSHEGVRATDRYFQAELFAQLTFFKRFQAQVNLPYGLRTRDFDATNQAIHGIGDAWLRVNYFPLMLEADENRSTSHVWGIGAGIKAPLGNFQPVGHMVDGLSPLPANFQLGTGSWDFLVQSVYQLQSFNWGVQMQVNSRINRSNRYLYQFGNQHSFQAVAFRYQHVGKHRFRFAAGGYGEWIQTDTQYTLEQTGTGGKGIFSTISVAYLQDAYSVELQVQTPLAQRYGTGRISAQSRVGFSFAYFL